MNYKQKLLSVAVGLVCVHVSHAESEKLADEEVIVRGIGGSYIKSVDGKREAQGIIDQIGADEIGRLPDKNIGETLNRIPGVSMLLEKGEGRFVQIRGISPRLNNVTFNGTSMGSPESDDGGRLAPMDMIGGELLSGVEVIKTQTPDMDAQGIGGTLNLVTKMPLEYEEQFTTIIGARVGTDEINDAAQFESGATPYSLDLQTIGKNDGATFGWSLGASYSDREYLALGIFQDDWREVEVDGDTLAYPEATKNNYYIIGRERINVNAAVEFQPTENANYFVRSFYTNWDEFQHRNRFEYRLSDASEITGGNSAVIDGNRVQANIRLENAEKEHLSVAVGGENIVGKWTLDYLGQVNQNSLDEPYSYFEFRSGSSTFGPDTISINGDGLVNVITGGEADPQDPAEQGFRRVRFQDRQLDEDGTILQVNALRDLAIGNLESAYIKFGAKYTLTSRENDYARDRYDEGDDWTLAQDPSLSNGAFTNEVPIQDRPNIWMNIDALNAFFRDPNNANFFEFNESDSFNREFASDYDLDETVTAAYVMGEFDFGKVEVITGVRIEQTDIDSSGFLIEDESANKISRDGSYTNVLPSIIANFDLTEKLKLRAAWTNTIGRPEYDDIAPRSELEVEDGEIGSVGSLTIGNPELEARESSNLDLSLEWYFAEGSLLSAAIFRKDIENELVNAPTETFQNYEFEGVVYDEFNIDTVINAREAELNGIELAYVQQFGFLPGLGIAASQTFIDSEIDIERGGEVETFPLPEQADSSTSLTAFYATDIWDIALTYNRNDSFLTDINGSPEEDLDQGAYESLSFRGSYQATKAIKIFLEGQNLNDEPTTEFQGGDENQNTEYEYVGRSYHIGITASF